jgi:hypothetical protein
MTIKSYYPNGFANGVAIQHVPLIITQQGNGNTFWVDSVHGSDGNQGNLRKPFATIDYAVGRCTANQGDQIMVAPNHTETVIAAAGLALDVEGITIIFLGDGDDRAKVTFTTAVTADMDVDADNITLINPRFVAGIDALTGPIDVNAANFSMVNYLYEDAVGIDTTDAIVAVPAAIGLHINGLRYLIGDEAGTQKQSHVQVNGVDNFIFENIDIVGDFATGPFENVTDELLNVRFENIKIKSTNAGPIPAMVIDANTTGFAKNIDLRIASGTTYVSSVAKLNWSNDCLGYNQDGYGGDQIGSGRAAGSVLLVQKTLVSSAILQAGVDITAASSGGALMLEDIFMATDATGLAAATNFQIESDNANGVTVFFAETIANLGANKTENIASGSVTAIAGTVLETGKKLLARATVADCTGVGTITLTMKFRRVVAGATVASA